MKVSCIIGIKTFTTGHGESTQFPILVIPKAFCDASTAAQFIQYDKTLPVEKRVIAEYSFDRLTVVDLEVLK